MQARGLGLEKYPKFSDKINKLLNIKGYFDTESLKKRLKMKNKRRSGAFNRMYLNISPVQHHYLLTQA